MESVLEAITQSELVHLDSGRDVVFETPSTDVLNSISQYFEDTVRRCEDLRAKPSSPASDSDSGDSLFLTQAVTPVLRAVKRHRSSERPDLFSSESDEENEAASNKGVSRLRKPRPAYVHPNRTEFPFLQKCRKYRFGRLPLRKNQVIVNSEIGGFFKCVQKISQGHGEQRTEPAVLEEQCVEEGNREEDHGNDDDDDDDDDIRIVDAECFIFDANKRNRQAWLPKTRRSVRLNKEKKPDKNKQKQKSQNQERAKAKTVQKQKEPQQTETRTNKTSQCKSRKEKQKSVSTVSRTSVSSPECSSTRQLLLDQEEHSEKQPEVLAAYSQSEIQVVDQHYHSRTHSAHQTAETCAENVPEGESDNERMVRETQMPDSDQTLVEAEETPVLEVVEDRSKESGEDGICLENIPFREVQESDKDPVEDGHHEVQDHEDCGDSIGSADLFDQDGNQMDELIDASSLTDEFRVKGVDEVQERCVVQCDERSPVREENNVAKQANVAIETDSPLFNYGGLTFLKRRKRKTSETSEVSQSLLSDAGHYNRSSVYNDVCGQKKRKTSSPLDEDDKGEEERSVDVRLLQEPAHVLSLSEANFAAGAKENQADENKVQSLSYSSDETCIEEDNQITCPTLEGLVSVAAAVTEPEPEPEPSTASRISTPVRNGEGSQQDDGSPEKSLVHLEGFEPLNIKKANHGDMLTMDYDKQVESSLGTTAQKPVQMTTQEGFLEDNEVARQERQDIPPTTSTQSDNPIEPLNSCDEEANRENQIFCKDIQSDDLITPKTKKKRHKVVEESLDLETSHIETTDCDEQQVTELVPKKKKRKREHDVEENVKTIESSSMKITMQGEEKILKKKKVCIKASHVQAAERTVEVVWDSEKQTAELIQENKMKKKKKNKSKLKVVGNNIGVEATEQVESLEVVQYFQQHNDESVPEKLKKKKKKKQVGENNTGVEACQVEAAEQAVELLEDSVKQTTQSVPEKKLKKKNMNEKVVENKIAEEAWQVKAAELVVEVHKDSEKQTTESVSKKKIKKKKKKEQVVENNVGVEATETVEALEDIQYYLQTTESVSEKKLKKKKEQVVENKIAKEAWQVKTAEQVKEVHKDSEKQTTESVSKKEIKKKKKKEQVVENIVGVEATETVEALEVVQYHLQTTESVPENKMKKKKKNKREQVAQNCVGDEACPVEAAEKTLEVFQLSEKRTTELVPENKLKKKKKNRTEHVVENNTGVEAWQVKSAEQVTEVHKDSSKQTTESVPEKKIKKKKKKEQVVENDVGVEATEKVKALEVVQVSEKQTTESVPEKELKKKKKQLVGNNVGDELCPVEPALEPASRALEVVQHHEQKATESVPEKKIKKKKKKQQLVENSVSVKQTETVEALEVVQYYQQTTESLPENKIKKKKNKRKTAVENSEGDEACPVEAAGKTVEIFQDSEKTTESVPQKKLKKKKERLVEKDLGDDVTESVPEQKLKKKKKKVVENNVGIETSHVEATQQVKALELVQLHQQQATEFNAEIKVMKKKKKKKREQFGEDSVGTEACPVESTDQVEMFEIAQHFQHQTTESEPEKRVNNKKKKNKRSFEVFQENMAVDFCEVIADCVQEAAELVPKKQKKKRKKVQDVEETVAVEAIHVATAEHGETLEFVQEAEQQCPELVSEIKVNKKIKKKRKKPEDVEENVDVEANSSSKQVDAAEKSERKKLKKKKRKQDAIDMGIRGDDRLFSTSS